MHRQQRAERVAVRALVGGEQEAVGGAQLVDDEVEIVVAWQRSAAALAHCGPSSSSLLRRMARSRLSS